MIAILYYSGSGHTKRLAEIIAEGIGEKTTLLLDATNLSEKDWRFLDQADGIIFGAPTYMGSVSAGFKAFMDESSGRWTKQIWADKIAAGFTVATYASGDKLVSLQQLSVFAAQHGMIWVGQKEIGPSGSDQAAINWQGSWLGMMATSSRDKAVLMVTGAKTCPTLSLELSFTWAASPANPALAAWGKIPRSCRPLVTRR